ncbi:MAG: DUF86 domain-containing protein [Gallionella sp.]|jgi:uncharacterized protein YutE (UPF0331/DUF86 family)|nr:DUF86 domain-containing protein [Gallionella sp.]
MNDILLGKAEIIERALARVEGTYTRHAGDIDTNIDAQDVIVLNLQRTCEAAIDMAMHLVRLRQLGLPKSSAEAFTLLAQNGLLDAKIAERMKKMVGFRNVAVHDYRELDWSILKSIITRDLQDVRNFSKQIVQQFADE